jgi:hypothetical protein
MESIIILCVINRAANIQYFILYIKPGSHFIQYVLQISHISPLFPVIYIVLSPNEGDEKPLPRSRLDQSRNN